MTKESQNKELLEVLPHKVRDLLGIMVNVNLRKSTGSQTGAGEKNFGENFKKDREK